MVDWNVQCESKNMRENIAKSFRGLLFLLTLYVYWKSHSPEYILSLVDSGRFRRDPLSCCPEVIKRNQTCISKNYHLLMCRENVFGRMCSVCLSVYSALPFESLQLESSVLFCSTSWEYSICLKFVYQVHGIKVRLYPVCGWFDWKALLLLLFLVKRGIILQCVMWQVLAWSFFVSAFRSLMTLRSRQIGR